VTSNPATDAEALRELLRILIRKLGVLERSEAACCEMTLSQCHALVEIGRAGMMSVNQLSERLGLDKSTVSRSADRLVLDGLLLREESATDRRYVSLKLSTKGTESYNNLEQRMATYFDSVVADIDQEERAMVLKGLQTLTKALGSAFIRAKKVSLPLQAGRDYSLREAEDGDFPDIRSLLTANDLPISGVDTDSGNFFVAVKSGLIMGAIGTEQQESAALLRSFVVHSEYRKSGIGRALMAKSIQSLKTGKIKAIYLLTNTAEQYFQQYGFIKIDRSEVPPELLANSALGTSCPASSACMKLA